MTQDAKESLTALALVCSAAAIFYAVIQIERHFELPRWVTPMTQGVSLILLLFILAKAAWRRWRPRRQGR